MIFVDDILTYFRGLGHAAEYGTLAQLNEQLTGVDYAASTDGMVAFVRLIGEQRTVDGYDTCDIAVHLSWLCPLDFDGETMLSTQEQAKDTLKAWINHLRGGNTVTVSEDARWQFGYDDFAENVAWVAVRVTLTAAAADCVPLSPEPPTPPTPQQSVHYCPQVLNYANLQGYPNPAKTVNHYRAAVSYCVPPEDTLRAKPLVVGSSSVLGFDTLDNGVEITEDVISAKRTALGYLPADRKMKPETEQWLRDRIGWKLYTFHFTMNVDTNVEYTQWLIAGTSALNCEKAKVNLIQ